MEAENKKRVAKGEPALTESEFQQILKKRRNLAVVVMIVAIIASSLIYILAGD